MRRKKQQTNLRPVGEVLLTILKKRGMASKIEENEVIKIWPKAVGHQIASQTQPDALRNGTLFVKTVSSVWVQQLHFIKGEILDKLNQLSDKAVVKEIRFITGHRLVGKMKEEMSLLAMKVVLKKRDKDMIDECTEGLADRELASVLKRVMQLEISRRRQIESRKVR